MTRAPMLGATFVAVLLGALALWLGATVRSSHGAAYSQAAGHSQVAARARADISRSFARMPLRFEANRGQAARSVDFLARGPGYTMALGRAGAVLAMTNGKASVAAQPAGTAVVGMHLIGASPSPTVSGIGRVAGTSNYLIGANRRRWHTGISSFARVRYRAVYPGVDLVYHGNQSELEYDLILAPRVNPGRIALGFGGARRLSITRSGDLLIYAPGRVILQRRPVAYQNVGATTRAVAGWYALEGAGHRVGFRVGSYDHSRPLVIDPSIAYSTFLGGYNTVTAGNSQDTTNGIAVDSQGNAYVVGFTDSIPPNAFPTTPGAVQQSFGGGARDAFITKLNAAGNGAVYSTYLGGSAEDRATGVAVGPNGNAYVSGFTLSTDFPTKNPLQAASGGGGNRDAFVAELNADGTGLVYSTYLGGSGTDTANRIAVDSSGAAYVAGTTAPAKGSTTDDFPTTPGSLQPSYGGGSSDAFVAKLKPDGSGLEYETFLGGSQDDSGTAIAVDSTGGAYVTGSTSSPSTFGTPGAFQTAVNAASGSDDVYVAKLNPAGSALAYATYLGGTSDNSGAGIALDSSNDAYITGATSSTDFPTRNAEQPANASAAGPNDYDSFVTKLNPAGSGLIFSTYNGSPTYDVGTDIAVDRSGNAYAVGETLGSFPLKDPVQVRTGDYDGFLTKFDPAGAVIYSTIYGGSARDFVLAVAADNAGNAYIGGRTDYYSPISFPIKNAFQPVHGGVGDGWTAKITPTLSSPLVNSLRARSGPVQGGTPVVISGTGFTGATAVSFGGARASRFAVNADSQITAVTPAHGTGQVNVTVTARGGTSPANPATLFEYAEGTWRLTGSLNVIHYDQQLTLLNDGRVLLTGGQNSLFGNTIPTTEIYNPKTRAWSRTGDLNTARSAYTVTRLDGPACRSAKPAAYCGDVLVAGGSPDNASKNTPLNTAETYSPASGKWSPTGNLNAARSQQAATLLDGPECHAGAPPAYCGKVLVSGGFGAVASPGASAPTLSSAELYDPATRQWTVTGSLGHTSRLTASVLLPGGKVLLAGGTGSDTTAAEIYDPATGTWGVTGSLNVGRARESLVVLANGKVLTAAGVPPGNPPHLGTPPQAGDSAELYNPSAGTWTLLPKRLIDSTRDNMDSAVLPSGKVLLADGGRGGITSELFDPATGKWSSAGLLNISRGSGNPQSGSFDAVVLSSNPEKLVGDPKVCGSDCGKVLVAGNSDDRSSELYTPPPTIDTLDVSSGTGGRSVKITGQGFTNGVSSVLFGARRAASFTVTSYGQITAVAPAGAGSVKISVVDEGGTATSSGSFTFPPLVTGYRLRNNPFVVGSGRPRAHGHKRGTTFRYTLSENASVKIVISQRGSGVRRGKRCVVRTRGRHGRGCIRIVFKGTLKRTGHKGANRIAFSGRIGSRALAPGRYQATLSASQANRTSKPQTILFTIVAS